MDDQRSLGSIKDLWIRGATGTCRHLVRDWMEEWRCVGNSTPSEEAPRTGSAAWPGAGTIETKRDDGKGFQIILDGWG